MTRVSIRFKPGTSANAALALPVAITAKAPELTRTSSFPPLVAFVAFTVVETIKFETVRL